MGDDPERPEPERTVIVEEAHLLRDQIEYSRDEQESADNDIEEAYHEKRVSESEVMLSRLEGEGLKEAAVRSVKEESEESADEYDEECPDFAREMAKLDTAKQVLREYFDDRQGPVALGTIAASTVYEGGVVELMGATDAAVLEVEDEVDARAAADSILQGAGLSLEEEQKPEVFQ